MIRSRNCRPVMHKKKKKRLTRLINDFPTIKVPISIGLKRRIIQKIWSGPSGWQYLDVASLSLSLKKKPKKSGASHLEKICRCKRRDWYPIPHGSKFYCLPNKLWVQPQKISSSIPSLWREGEHQAIIPGLPDDLAIQCLARISHGYHGVLECVSKRWRDVMRSSVYSHIKAANGWSGYWWFVLTERQHDGQWNAYDPEANNWHHLPRFHTDEPPGDHLGFSCVTVCKKFLVIGGFYESPLSPIFPELKTSVMDDVWLFDPFEKQWSRRASMKMPRSEFACVVTSGKVHVAGGYNSSEPGGITNAEVYDPVTDRWEDLPPMPFPQMECSGVSRVDFMSLVEK
ncbi:F-box/kelch-repeat protein [Acorus calamus]|uniref:F-box/kelch-repeat protein n=1 Tax=Acorus calamus TaxID=4465 RepID=A0AAV9CS05_ACOCL|nr:F-box/kelch-repeat protein [Acorus calamus]